MSSLGSSLQAADSDSGRDWWEFATAEPDLCFDLWYHPLVRPKRTASIQMSLRVNSEIGTLERVLAHRPGAEIDLMVPSMMERLLFDDILHGPKARDEHGRFVEVLKKLGVEVLDPREVLERVLDQPGARRQLLDGLDHLGLDRRITEPLGGLAAAELASTLIVGIPTQHELPTSGSSRFYDLAPIPNYFFQRDPLVVMGDRAVVAAMATEARGREPLLSRLCIDYEPGLAAADVVDLQAYASRQNPALEGGDILIANRETLLVGLSERTNRAGIEALANYLRVCSTGFRRLIIVEIPARRSYMHLDTVFTFIDRAECLAYMPVIAPNGAESGSVFTVDLTARHLSYRVCDNLVAALAEIGLEIELIPCGGSASLIDQQREQWTDGANAFALAPGLITTYSRNRRTAAELDRRGWRVMTADEVETGDSLTDRPTVITLEDNELSRARGGPRCMTMPIERRPLE